MSADGADDLTFNDYTPSAGGWSIVDGDEFFSGSKALASSTTTFTSDVYFRITSYNVCYTKLLRPFCDPFSTAESEVWSFTTTSSCEVPN